MLLIMLDNTCVQIIQNKTRAMIYILDNIVDTFGSQNKILASRFRICEHENAN